MSRSKELQKTDTNIGIKLKSLRIARGLTLDDLQEKTSFSTAMLSYYEDAKRPIPANRLKKLAEILEVDISTFFDGCSKADIANISSRHLQISRKLAKINDEPSLLLVKQVCDFALKKS